MTTIQIGEYEHFKGKRYEVIGVAQHSETLEEFVVYRHKDESRELWIRPIKMFLENVEVEGKIVPRFKYVKE